MLRPGSIIRVRRGIRWARLSTHGQTHKSLFGGGWVRFGVTILLVADYLEKTSIDLAFVVKGLHERGWLLGTSGNLSAVVSTEPLRLAITASGIDKGQLTSKDIVLIDEDTRVVSETNAKPSDESKLHVTVVKRLDAGAVIHTHSVWNTILSDLFASQGGLKIENYEMLKGLRGVKTHEHCEWLPIIDNLQDMTTLAMSMEKVLHKHPSAHGVLLRRHGLYTWGSDLTEAKRHVEILEFLLETVGRTLELNRYQA